MTDVITGDAVEKWLREVDPESIVYLPGENVSCNCPVTQYAKTVFEKAYSSAPNYGGRDGEAPGYIYKRVEYREVKLVATDERATRMMHIFDDAKDIHKGLTAAKALKIIEEGKI